MVIRGANTQRGAMMMELVVAMALWSVALLPLAYSFMAEKRLARASYQRAVAIQLVDGEMEVLMAGEWKKYTPGKHEYKITGHAVSNLAPGKFMLVLQPPRLKLEWQPAFKDYGGRVSRGITLR